jgi:NADPH2:quinone reductase
MHAWRVTRYGEPASALARLDVDEPEPGPGFLRVRVGGAALGLPDVFLCRGSYALTPALPFTPGQELVGVVSAAGPGTSARVGERVMAVSGFFVGHGAFAESALAIDDFAFPASDEWTDAEAAGFVIPYHTAYVGLVRRAELRAGETLLVLGGAGGTGSAAIQLGAALGARVLTTAAGAEKAAFCRAQGAEAVIDYRSEDIAGRVRELTDGHGADVVYDPVGGDAFTAATRCIAHEGRLLVVGFASGRWGTPESAHLVTHGYSLLGVMPSGYDRAFKLAAQESLRARHAAGALRPPVARTLRGAQLVGGLEDLAHGRVTGRLVWLGD